MRVLNKAVLEMRFVLPCEGQSAHGVIQVDPYSRQVGVKPAIRLLRIGIAGTDFTDELTS